MGLEYDLRQERVIHLNLTEFTEVEAGTSVRATIEKISRATPGARRNRAW